MFPLQEIQAALREFEIDGWLLFDFRGSNVLARRVMGMQSMPPTSRRFFYYIPAEGEPTKLVHRIENDSLDHLPGKKRVYLKWQELESGVAEIIGDDKTVAMEYSPEGGNPYVSRVDGGTIELAAKSGAAIVSSGDLVQQFEAVWSDEQWELHKKASALIVAAFERAWAFVADHVRRGETVRETQVQNMLVEYFHSHSIAYGHAPIVGVGPNSGNPHYEPKQGADRVINENDFLLLDIWGKLDRPNGVYADYTQVGFIGETVPAEYTEIFNIVAAARDAGIDLVRHRMAADETVFGWEVDDAVRKVINDAGYGEYFIHRTGHNIGAETHGNGANIDNLETRDARRLLPRTCFSIEPGIYREPFGVRSEVNVYIDANRHVQVTGVLQSEVIPVMKAYPPKPDEDE